MSDNRAQSINVAELSKTVSAAVEQIKNNKLLHSELTSGSLIMGRYLRELAADSAQHQAVQAVAEHITREVNTQVAGLNAKPFVGGGIGGTTMGFILNEQ